MILPIFISLRLPPERGNLVTGFAAAFEVEGPDFNPYHPFNRDKDGNLPSYIMEFSALSYAMRARLALRSAGIEVELREISC